MTEKYVRLDDVRKLMQHLSYSNGFIDNEFAKFLPTYDTLETNVGRMDAIEILEWLKNAKMSDTRQCFNQCDINSILEHFSPQEIISRIEKYEADHIVDANKKVEHVEPAKEEKKVNETSNIYRFAEWCYVNGINFGFMSTAENPTPKRLREIVGRYESEIEKPKEEELEDHCPICYYTHKQEYEYPCNRCKYGDGEIDYFTTEPKEETQKIEKLDLTQYSGFWLLQKINEIIDVVNELRGV